MAVDLTRANALNTTTDLAEAGAVFNDATRLIDGGLWNSPNNLNNQANYLGMYQGDITALQNDIAAALQTGATINGAAFALTPQDTAVLQQVQGQLGMLQNAAPHAIGPGNNRADATLHNVTNAILNEVNGDANLAGALHNAAYTANTGATDNPFQTLAAPVAAAAAATAPGATLADIGAVFNAADNLAVGGLNNHNIGQFNTDIQAAKTGVDNILNNPMALAAIEQNQMPADAALTTIHLQTVSNQLGLQLQQFDNQLHTNPTVAARGTNDNLLDIIDIVQNDPALNAAAGNGGNVSHTGGFASQPGYLTGTITHFQDNQAQTNFWSQFVSESNTLNTALQNVANGTAATPADIATLETNLQNYQSFSMSFAAGQNGVFSARFNNELVNGTVNADTAAALHGLQGIANGDTGTALAADQAQLTAAGMGFAANAADVSGNNTPLGGTAYNANATTVATATTPNNLATGTIPVTGAANPNTGLAVATQNVAQNAQGQQGQAAMDMAAAQTAANAPAAAIAATPAANPAPAAGDHLAAMVDAAMANLTSPPAAMTAAAAGANTPPAADPAPAALSAAGPAAADHAAIDMAHHSALDNNHISTAHDQFHHIWW